MNEGTGCGTEVRETPGVPPVGVKDCIGLFRCGKLVPKLPADVLEVARLLPAELAASNKVEPCELKLLM